MCAYSTNKGSSYTNLLTASTQESLDKRCEHIGGICIDQASKGALFKAFFFAALYLACLCKYKLYF
jgi:hypothetical protein